MNMTLSQCKGLGKSERSWSHLEEAVVSPLWPVGVLGHPVGRVMVVVITHQHNSMVKLHLGIVARPVHRLRIAVVLEEGLKIYNSTCRKGGYSISASVIHKKNAAAGVAAAGQGKITTISSTARAAEKEEMADVAEALSQQALSKHNY
jgi:hypothetical protein